MRSEIDGAERVFVAEYDFSKFFNNISHSHIEETLESKRFALTPVELMIIRGFLRAMPVPQGEYQYGCAAPVRTRGIPQGTAISLFLANIAAWKIDHALESIGVGFIRYADDTVIWSKDYAAICDAVSALNEHGTAMGVDINYNKSPGISILTPSSVPEKSVEMKSVHSLEFLGYNLEIGHAKIKNKACHRIKAKVLAIIYDNLLREVLLGGLSPDRLDGSIDKDYVVLILQLRRYLYGDMSEKLVQRYQRGDVPFRRFKGLMAAYPHLSDSNQLLELDGWLLDSIYLALRKRYRILENSGVQAPAPSGTTREGLLSLRTTSNRTGENVDLRVPSFRRIANIIRRASIAYGTSGIVSSLPYGYYE